MGRRGLRVRVWRHVPFEDLGLLRPLLEACGARIETVDVPLTAAADLGGRDADLLVVLGGPIGAGDDQSFPFLVPERALLRERLERGRPTLGICLGAQLMGHALGASVEPAPHKEIGWGRVTLTDSGLRGCLGELGSSEPTVLHWHGDNVGLPESGERLAWNAACPNQAFALGDHGLGLQFHLEARPADIEAWLVGHVHEIGATPGRSVQALRSEAQRHGEAVARAGRAVLARWLAGCGLA